MAARILTALPVYNEAKHVVSVLNQVRQYSSEVLVVDDGSVDGGSELLRNYPGIHLVRHPVNRGYGAALLTAFDFAIRNEYETVITIDCDGQHEPQRISDFVAAAPRADIISGSRYLQHFPGDTAPPEERRRVNAMITSELNRRLCLNLTDAFCGFKAYSTQALLRLQLSEPGYAMPLQLWVEAARAGLTVQELPVPLIYLDEKRSFGGALDDVETRLYYYHLVLDRSLAKGLPLPEGQVWTGTLCGAVNGIAAGKGISR